DDVFGYPFTGPMAEENAALIKSPFGPFFTICDVCFVIILGVFKEFPGALVQGLFNPAYPKVGEGTAQRGYADILPVDPMRPAGVPVQGYQGATRAPQGLHAPLTRLADGRQDMPRALQQPFDNHQQGQASSGLGQCCLAERQPCREVGQCGEDTQLNEQRGDFPEDLPVSLKDVEGGQFLLPYLSLGYIHQFLDMVRRAPAPRER